MCLNKKDKNINVPLSKKAYRKLGSNKKESIRAFEGSKFLSFDCDLPRGFPRCNNNW